MGEIKNFAGGTEPEEEWFWQFKLFSKLKSAFCEYWKSNKIKINLTFVSKECEVKTKMIGAMTTAKNDVFIGF